MNNLLFMPNGQIYVSTDLDLLQGLGPAIVRHVPSVSYIRIQLPLVSIILIISLKEIHV